MSKETDKRKIINNYKKVDTEINQIQESIKRKYIYNKKYMTFLSDILEDTTYKHKKITKS